MTRKELEEALAEIGWKIRKSYEGNNDFLINSLGEETAIALFGKAEPRLEIRNEHKTFGEYHGGFGLYLDGLTAKVREGANRKFVCLSANKHVFINLYDQRKPNSDGAKKKNQDASK